MHYKHSLALYLLGIGSVVVSSALGIVIWLTSPNENDIGFRLLDPIDDDAVVAAPDAQVEFTYRLQNFGRKALTGVRADLSCACVRIRELPSIVPSGEEVILSFHLRAPKTGSRRESVSIFADGTNGPVVLLHPMVRVLETPPRFIKSPEFVRIAVLRGQNLSHDLLLTTVEFAGQPHFIEKISPSIDIEAQLVGVHEQPGEDQSTVIRAYHYNLSALAADLDVSASGRLYVALSEMDRSRMHSIPLELTIQDPILLLPRSLDFAIGHTAVGQSKQIMVIHRDGASSKDIGDVEYDEKIICVNVVRGSRGKVEALLVTPAGRAEASTDTTIVIDCDGRTVEVPVRLRANAPLVAPGAFPQGSRKPSITDKRPRGGDAVNEDE